MTVMHEKDESWTVVQPKFGGNPRFEQSFLRLESGAGVSRTGRL